MRLIAAIIGYFSVVIILGLIYLGLVIGGLVVLGLWIASSESAWPLLNLLWMIPAALCVLALEFWAAYGAFNLAVKIGWQ